MAYRQEPAEELQFTLKETGEVIDCKGNLLGYNNNIRAQQPGTNLTEIHAEQPKAPVAGSSRRVVYRQPKPSERARKTTAEQQAAWDALG